MRKLRSSKSPVACTAPVTFRDFSSCCPIPQRDAGSRISAWFFQAAGPKPNLPALVGGPAGYQRLDIPTTMCQCHPVASSLSRAATARFQQTRPTWAPRVPRNQTQVQGFRAFKVEEHGHALRIIVVGPALFSRTSELLEHGRGSMQIEILPEQCPSLLLTLDLQIRCRETGQVKTSLVKQAKDTGHTSDVLVDLEGSPHETWQTQAPSLT